MVNAAKRYLWLVFPGVGTLLVISVLVRIVTVYILATTSNSMGLSVALNRQANRTTVMRQDVSDYVTTPTAAYLKKLNTDYQSWHTGETDLLNNLSEYDQTVQDQIAKTAVPAAGIDQWITVITAAKTSDPLTDYYIHLVVYVGQYNIALNDSSADELALNMTAIDTALWSNIIVGVVIVIVFGVELIFALLPAYYDLRDTVNGNKEPEPIIPLPVMEEAHEQRSSEP